MEILAPYVSNFNPIERAFGKLKIVLRQAEARIQRALEAAIGVGLVTITSAGAHG